MNTHGCPSREYYKIMYAFSKGQIYHQTRKELAYIMRNLIVSMRTVTDWFSYCWETIAIYESEVPRPQGKIGGSNKLVQIDESVVKNI